MKVRISTLMRIGRKHTERVIDAFTETNLDGTIGWTCAWGAARFGVARLELDKTKLSYIPPEPRKKINPKAREEIKKEDLPESMKGEFPGYERYVPFQSIVVRLNDGYKWSRKAIADYIDYLIDEKGYHLFADVDTDLRIRDTGDEVEIIEPSDVTPDDLVEDETPQKEEAMALA